MLVTLTIDDVNEVFRSSPSSVNFRVFYNFVDLNTNFILLLVFSLILLKSIEFKELISDVAIEGLSIDYMEFIKSSFFSISISSTLKTFLL